MATKEKSITDNLGIDPAWVEKSLKLIEEDVKSTDTVSSSMLKVITRLKDEEFGGEFPATDFEKKLIYAGYVIYSKTRKLSSSGTQDALINGLISSLLGGGSAKIIGLDLTPKKPDDDEDDE